MNTSLKKQYVFYHITAKTEYNPYSTDMSDILLREGVIPHYGTRQGKQEDGFFVWTNVRQALQHALVFARGDCSLITVKVPCNTVCFPTWKFDLEGIFYDPFLLNGLCAKHPKIATTIFQSKDFQEEIQDILKQGTLCLKHEKISPCLALFDKNDDLFYVVNELCGIMGYQIVDELELRYPFIRSEIQKISKAIENKETLPNYPMLSSYSSFWDVWQNNDFQRCFLEQFQEQVHALNTDNTFLQNLAKRTPLARRLKRFQLCLSDKKVSVFHQMNDYFVQLDCTDAGYEKILDGLLKRSFVLQQEYNTLLRKRAENGSIGIMVDNIPYPEIGNYPLKYTGHTPMKIFCATRLKKAGMIMRALEHPRQ